MSDLDRAADAIDDGELVIYPTETVYGLAGDALDPDAVQRVFDVKGRDRSKPVSLAVPSVDAATDYTEPSERELAFMRAFLPGPVTVLAQRRSSVPDVLTAGRDRVGIRVPDHELALALLERVAPITSTSANVSGEPSARTVEEIGESVRADAAVVLDGGRTPGTESTVVDVAADEIVREGADCEAIRAWLADH
ncbi:L-threonylcarbamoyladenylate synthase [Halomicrobium sp. LC1Hm]|uniref:L-threonylcarbamoyladenylate synthase n=1 Tax=Halomicrobium sp. LC1Hm TaxID=2610902 RepID=UPI001298268E|nr:L-threonylcarbamoyladenylate synthase [Halomicrobium sp. LC1Hm]QGA81146.1 tRNA A37 threonylcarbamoyladenosine synthetase subunit TsaC/SUA5/YrdC [Halomicrobium sp. LC1Hm]